MHDMCRYIYLMTYLLLMTSKEGGGKGFEGRGLDHPGLRHRILGRYDRNNIHGVDKYFMGKINKIT